MIYKIFRRGVCEMRSPAAIFHSLSRPFTDWWETRYKGSWSRICRSSAGVWPLNWTTQCFGILDAGWAALGPKFWAGAPSLLRHLAAPTSPEFATVRQYLSSSQTLLSRWQSSPKHTRNTLHSYQRSYLESLPLTLCYRGLPNMRQHG